MKKGFIVIIALMSVMSVWAQTTPKSFFDDNGLMRIETQELSETSGNIVSVFHRSDDIVWSRVVYRIIDMRYLQNYQLYMPVSGTDPKYSSLLKVMLNAMADGMPVYEKDPNGDIKPYINEDMKSVGKDALTWFDLAQLLNPDDTEDIRAEVRVMKYDPSADKLSLDVNRFDQFARNQLKYMIQEVIFFDKHYSRLYSKILAIAPMHADNMQLDAVESSSEKSSEEIMGALWQQILFWVPFDSFRPYMAKQYMTPKKNDNQRVTYDEFFEQRKFSSYIIGTNNVYNRMIPELVSSKLEGEALREAIKKEQDRVENELLNVEQDLWEY